MRRRRAGEGVAMPFDGGQQSATSALGQRLLEIVEQDLFEGPADRLPLLVLHEVLELAWDAAWLSSSTPRRKAPLRQQFLNPSPGATIRLTVTATVGPGECRRALQHHVQRPRSSRGCSRCTTRCTSRAIRRNRLAKAIATASASGVGSNDVDNWPATCPR